MSRTPAFFEKVFLLLPRPLSQWVFWGARYTVLKDRRLRLFEPVFRRVAETRMEGDYLEFGVYRGASFMTSWRLAKKYGLDRMRFFAFDCFTGLPEGEGPDWKPGMCAASRKKFETVIRKAGADPRRVVVVEGLYRDTLHAETKRAHGLKDAAVIHIDCDLYPSTLDALHFVEDLIQVGTALLFDDWECFEGAEAYGEQRAFREWGHADCFEEIYRLGQCKGFICTKPPA